MLTPLIWVPVLAVLAMSLAVAGFSELNARRTDANHARIAQALLRLEALADLRARIVDAETGQRGYLLTGDPEYLRPFTSAAQGLPDAIARLRELTSDAPQAAEALNRAGTLMAERLTVASNIVREYERAGAEAATTLMKSANGQRLMDALRSELATLDALTRAELDALQSEQLAASRASRARLLVMTLVSLGLLLMLVRQFAVSALRQERRRSAAEQEARTLERLVAARTRELARLSTHLQDFAEKEKAELAHNLHDELGGLMTAAKMDLAWLQGRVADPLIGQRLEQLGRALDEAMDVKRRVVESLRPSLLDHFGLATALKAFLDAAVRKTTLAIEVSVDEALDHEVPKDIAIGLFRIVQEAFTNVVRHARARHVWIELVRETEAYRLTIRDDGRGFDPLSSSAHASHGIAGMRHRVRALQGRFAIDSARGRGTRVTVEVPLVREVPRAAAQGGAGEAHLERASATSALSSAMSRILSRK